MGTIKNEIGNIYGSWEVIQYIGKPPNTNGSEWRCSCTRCGNKQIIRGANLRRNKLPKCNTCCLHCGKRRSETKFSRGNICDSCKKSNLTLWRNINEFKVKETYRLWCKNNVDKVKKNRSTVRRRYQTTPERFLNKMLKQKINHYNHLIAQNNDKACRYVVNISITYIVSLWYKQNGKCALSGIPMSTMFKTIDCVSIDRIDRTIGYIEGNIQLVCRWVNFGKNSFDDSDILKMFNKLRSIDTVK